MRKAVFERYGRPEVLAIVECDEPRVVVDSTHSVATDPDRPPHRRHRPHDRRDGVLTVA